MQRYVMGDELTLEIRRGEEKLEIKAPRPEVASRKIRLKVSNRIGLWNAA